MRRARILVCQFMGLSLLCQMPGWLHAQTVTGTLVGTVTDSSGGRMSGTTVTAANELTQEKHSTVTNTEGYYLLTALPVGPYRVEVEAQGFKRFLRRGIVLDVNQNARIDAKLEVGQVTQQVVVTADVPLVDTREAQLGWMVDNRRGGRLAVAQPHHRSGHRRSALRAPPRLPWSALRWLRQCPAPVQFRYHPTACNLS